MLFEKKIEPRCAYCTRCAPLDEETVMCLKKGVMPAASHCRAFRYAPDFSRLRDEDFVL